MSGFRSPAVGTAAGERLRRIVPEPIGELLEVVDWALARARARAWREEEVADGEEAGAEGNNTK
jgi:hypothetical protein